MWQALIVTVCACVRISYSVCVQSGVCVCECVGVCVCVSVSLCVYRCEYICVCVCVSVCVLITLLWPCLSLSQRSSVLEACEAHRQAVCCCQMCDHKTHSTPTPSPYTAAETHTK